MPRDRRRGYACAVSTTKLLLTTGEQVEVEGMIQEVERSLENAARSTSGTLAWLKDTGTSESVGVNPAHVVTVRPGDG
jgi:hypothetical protein